MWPALLRYVCDHSESFGLAKIEHPIHAILLSRQAFRQIGRQRLTWLLFAGDVTAPFAVARHYASPNYNFLVEREYQICRELWEKFSEPIVPQPICLATIEDYLVFFEKAFRGSSLTAEIAHRSQSDPSGKTILGMVESHLQIATSLIQRMNSTGERSSSTDLEAELFQIYWKCQSYLGIGKEERLLLDVALGILMSLGEAIPLRKRIVNFDFVPSNILRNNDQVVLVDWEYHRQSTFWPFEALKFIYGYLVELERWGWLKAGNRGFEKYLQGQLGEIGNLMDHFLKELGLPVCEPRWRQALGLFYFLIEWDLVTSVAADFSRMQQVLKEQLWQTLGHEGLERARSIQRMEELQARLEEQQGKIQGLQEELASKQQKVEELQARLRWKRYRIADRLVVIYWYIRCLTSSTCKSCIFRSFQSRRRFCERQVERLRHFIKYLGRPVYRISPPWVKRMLKWIYSSLFVPKRRVLVVSKPMSTVSDAELPVLKFAHQRKRRPRIAYLTNQLLDWKTQEPRFGGGERYCLTLGRLLEKLGFEVTFYQAAFKNFEEQYFNFKVVGIPIGKSYSEFQYEVCDAFYNYSQKYDHAIYNLPEYASGKVRKDSILICHGIWFDHNNYGNFRTTEWFEHLYKAFSQPQKIVSVDTNSINVIRALWPEIAKKMKYIPNWVDVQIFRPPNQRDESCLTILFPRRAQVNRGSRILERILAYIPYDVRFLWVGDGDAEDTELIKTLAQRDQRLKFCVASFDEMPGFYQRAHICVIPTLASEGTSLSCLEALASGCAVIATNVGGLPDLIQPNVNGLLVDPDPFEIAKAINYLIEHPYERQRLAAAGRRTAEHFSLEIWEKRWEELLREIGWI